MRRAAALPIAMLLLAGAAGAEQKDVTGCKDHALFTRMPTYWIHGCTEKAFDAYAFPVGNGKTERVEGRLWKLTYYPQADAKIKPSELEILRNFENAAAKLGGTVAATAKSRETLRLVKDGKELWVEVWAEFTGKYGLTIVEKSGMAQEIVANAAAFSASLEATGHAAVYGILFDTNKAEIKPESAQAIAEIAKLLQGDPGLKLYVVGHTDATGGVDSNLRLSQERAEAVLQALVRTHTIAAARLRSFGAGPFAPVASNGSEDGRAKNRRVELVKQ
jgi:OmpA-OmpF porin, OOP family